MIVDYRETYDCCRCGRLAGPDALDAETRQPVCDRCHNDCVYSHPFGCECIVVESLESGDG